MVAVAGDHLAQLLAPVLHNVGVGFRPHVLECIWSPRRHLGLNHDAVAVTIVKYPAVLPPVDSGKYAIQMFEIGVVMFNPFLRLRHTELGIVAAHALHAHEPNALAVEIKSGVSHFEAANSESGLKAVARR